MIEWLVDGVIGILILEVLLLALAGRRFPRLPTLASMVPNLAAGLCLVLAVRSALAQQSLLVMACLAGAGIAHVFDLRGRRPR